MSVLADYLKRIEVAIVELDLGVTTAELSADFLRAANRALSEIGAARVLSIEDLPGLRRAAEQLEAAT